MCRISVLVPKKDKKLTRSDLTPLILTLLENGEIMKEGTGLVLCQKNPLIMKKSVSSPKFILENNDFFEFLNVNYNNQTIIAHTRLATAGKGKTEDSNAHPFNTGSLVGVHNGHFSNYQAVATEMKFENCVVDSDVFYRYLNSLLVLDDGGYRSVKLEDIQKAVNKFYGSFALAFYDIVDDKTWLVTGANDLNIHYLESSYLINTSPVLEIAALGDKLNTFNKGVPPFDGYKVEKLDSFTAYMIDSDGLRYIGKITESKYQDNYSYANRSYIHNDQTTTSIDVKNIAEIFHQMKNLRLLAGLADNGIKDLIAILPDMPKALADLNLEHISILKGFITYLKTNNLWDEEEIFEKQKLWEDFYYNLPTTDEYAKASEFIPGFQYPFFLNDLVTLQKLAEYDPAKD